MEAPERRFTGTSSEAVPPAGRPTCSATHRAIVSMLLIRSVRGRPMITR